MSLRRLPQDLCTLSHRHAPCPPRLVGATHTGGKPDLSSLLAIAQRQIAQKRRFRHWRHARQLSLSIREAEISALIERFGQKGQKPSKNSLIRIMVHLVAVRSEHQWSHDTLGVLQTSARLLCINALIQRYKTEP